MNRCNGPTWAWNYTAVVLADWALPDARSPDQTMAGR